MMPTNQQPTIQQSTVSKPEPGSQPEPGDLQHLPDTSRPLIQFRQEQFQPSQLAEFLALYQASGIIRPLTDQSRMAQMLTTANLLLTARIDGRLVGLARCLTDQAYVCYISDLLVCRSVQRQGIGRAILAELGQLLGPKVQLLLLSAPTAMEYYPKVGFSPLQNAFAISREG